MLKSTGIRKPVKFEKFLKHEKFVKYDPNTPCPRIRNLQLFDSERSLRLILEGVVMGEKTEYYSTITDPKEKIVNICVTYILRKITSKEVIARTVVPLPFDSPNVGHSLDHPYGKYLSMCSIGKNELPSLYDLYFTQERDEKWEEERAPKEIMNKIDPMFYFMMDDYRKGVKTVEKIVGGYSLKSLPVVPATIVESSPERIPIFKKKIETKPPMIIKPGPNIIKVDGESTNVEAYIIAQASLIQPLVRTKIDSDITDHVASIRENADKFMRVSNQWLPIRIYNQTGICYMCFCTFTKTEIVVDSTSRSMFIHFVNKRYAKFTDGILDMRLSNPICYSHRERELLLAIKRYETNI